MLNVFLLVPELTQPEAEPARLLATSLPRDIFTVTVGVLGPTTGYAAEELRAAGLTVESVPFRHSLDLSGASRLRRVVQDAAPAVFHTFGSDAARVARLVTSSDGEDGNIPRFVVSAGAAPGNGLGGWLAARQVRRADRVIASTRDEAKRYRTLGVKTERLTRISPAVPIPEKADADKFFSEQELPVGARVIVASGRPECGSGARDAIVAFDMLRYEVRDLYLVVTDAGAGAGGLEHFGRSLAFDDFRIRFVEQPWRATAAILNATQVWVTSFHGGYEDALRGMAAGKPVIAWDRPDLSEIIENDRTGYLVPIGDKAALASRARSLLNDPALAAMIGETGRVRASERFSVLRMVEQFGRVYLELAG
jgi:glycosyltransferase involved in cell wall biosynthesis